MELAMPRRIDDLNQMDGATRVAVCKGIGERLRQNLAVDGGALPARLQNLLEQLQQRENDVAPRSH